MDSVSPKARAVRFLEVFDWPSVEGQPSQDPLQYWQARVLHSLFLTSVILGFFAVVPSIWLSIKEGFYGVAVFDAGVYSFVVFLFFKKAIPYAVRAATITIVIYLVGLLLFFTFGLSGAGPVWLFAFPIITGVLLGYRAALIALSINGATLILVGVFLFTGALSWEYPVINPIAKWVVIFFNFMLLNALATVSLTAILKGLQDALRQEKLLGISLQQKHTELDRSNRDLQESVQRKCF